MKSPELCLKSLKSLFAQLSQKIWLKKSFKWPTTQIAERVMLKNSCITPGERVFGIFCTLFAVFFEV